MKQLISALAAMALLSACEAEFIPTDTYLDLELTCTSSKNNTYKKAIVTVDQVIMLRTSSDSIVYDSIPRSASEVRITPGTSKMEWLGSYYIETPRMVNHLELMVPQIALQTDSGYFNYKVPANYWVGVKNLNKNLYPADVDPVIINLDLSRSQTLDSANQKWIKPIFN